jgi:3-oxoacyl-[acyl-carrier protein] reductase
MTNYFDLSNKVALVTGASSGIGAASAKVLAELGADVAITYHQNQAGAEKVRDEIASIGRKAVVINADVRDPKQITATVSRVNEEFGAIDILVNNAGTLVGRTKNLEMTKEFWDEVVNLNLTSAMLCSRAVAPSMVERKSGTIINVVSIAAHNGGGPGSGAYSAAKAGLIALTKSQAKELAPHGVRVNAISPGTIDTHFHEVFSTPEMLKAAVATIPMGRLGTPEDCAKVIAFLASDAAGYLVGETIEVNGGQLMR